MGDRYEVHLELQNVRRSRGNQKLLQNNGQLSFENLAFSLPQSANSTPGDKQREESAFVDAYLQNSPEVHCPNHEEQVATLYCYDCKQYCCPTPQCAMGTHARHDVVPYRQVVLDKWRELTTNVSALKDVLRRAEENRVHLRETRDMVTEAAEAIEREVLDHFEAIEHALEAKKLAMLREITRTKESYTDNCERQERQLNKFVTTCCDETDACLNQGLLAVVQAEGNLFEMADSVKYHLSSSKEQCPLFPIPEVPRFNVDWNMGHLQSMQQMCDSLGSVQVTYQKKCNMIVQKMSTRCATDKQPQVLLSSCICPAPGTFLGDLLVTDVANQRIKQFSSTGKLVRCFIGGGRFQCRRPSCVRVFLTGEIVVSDPAQSKLVLFNELAIAVDSFGVEACESFCVTEPITHLLLPRSGSLSSWASLVSSRSARLTSGRTQTPTLTSNNSTAEESAADSAFPTSVNLVVLNAHSKVLEQVTLSQKKLYKCRNDIPLLHNNELSKPTSIEFNHRSELFFIGDAVELAVMAFNMDGKMLRRCSLVEEEVATHARWRYTDSPPCLLCDASGHMLICDGIAHRVQVLDEKGIFLRFLPVEEELASMPVTMCFDEKRNLVLVLQDGSVLRVSYELL